MKSAYPGLRTNSGLLVWGALGLLLAMGGIGVASIEAHPTSTAIATLTDDSGGLALFPAVANLSPGDSATQCIAVAASGAGGAESVVVAATGVSGLLTNWLDVDIDEGAGGGYGDCSGFAGRRIFSGRLADLAAAPGDGVATGWQPGPSDTRIFRFTISLPAGTSSAASQKSAQAIFVWRMEVASPSPTPTPTPAPTSAPTATPTPTSAPTPTRSPAPAIGVLTPPQATSAATTTRPAAEPAEGLSPQGAAGLGAGSGHRGREITLRPSLSSRMAATAQAIIAQPQFLLGPLLAALAFLLVQHLIDRHDPKLAAASRTRRESTLVFPAEYERRPGQ